MTEPIPLVDLAVQHAQVADEVAAGWDRVTATGAFILGPDVAAFEEEFAAFTGAAHCVGVANGTDALELALRARGVGPGDEVILPANTFIATAEAVSRVGARRCWSTATPTTCSSTRRWRPRRSPPGPGPSWPSTSTGRWPRSTRWPDVLPAGVDLIEDAAQSQGATRHGRRSGGVGRSPAPASTRARTSAPTATPAPCSPTTTPPPPRVRALRRPRRHPQVPPRPGRHELPARHPAGRGAAGQAARLAELERAAAGGRPPLRRAARAATTASACRRRCRATSTCGTSTWSGSPGATRCWPALNAAGIGAGIHYPQPVHLLGAYADLGHGPGDFPVAEAAAAEILSLPLFPGITAAQQERVAAELLAAVGGAA